jgi:thiosulfate/3-mercaptopyruvate sulfurtransferase
MSLPLLLESALLQEHLQDPNICLVDLCKAQTYQQAHIPGALHLEYPQIVAIDKPVMGLLPSVDHLQSIVKQLGINNNTHVVAYDDEGGGCASRLLWTLDYLGITSYSLLNGGLHAWLDEQRQCESQPSPLPEAGDVTININPGVVADSEYILERLQDERFAILDARSTEEFTGRKKLAARAGHIPGAVNLDWLLLMDQNRKLRLKPPEELRLMLGSLEVTAQKEVIVYCQSHHRSALSYIALKSLGYEHIRGYPGSWSDWGNRDDTPVEV